MTDEPKKYKSMSDFFRNATPEEQMEVARKAAEGANEDQRRLMERASLENPLRGRIAEIVDDFDSTREHRIAIDRLEALFRLTLQEEVDKALYRAGREIEALPDEPAHWKKAVDSILRNHALQQRK